MPGREYQALSNATTRAIFLVRLLEEAGFKQQGPTVLFEDNKSAVTMAEVPHCIGPNTGSIRDEDWTG